MNILDLATPPFDNPASIDTIQIVIPCIIGAVILAIAIFVIIKLLNKKKK